MFKLLKNRHQGAVGFEAMILMPLISITFIALLYFFFMVLTYICYNNVANSIAHKLNMRQTGYQEAMSEYPTMPLIWSYRNNIIGNGAIDSGHYLSASQITFDPYTDALKSGTYAALDTFSQNFIIPFSEVKQVKVTTTKPVNPSDGSHMAGNVITVEIYYTSMFTFGSENGVSILPLMKAVGYNIIS